MNDEFGQNFSLSDTPLKKSLNEKPTKKLIISILIAAVLLGVIIIILIILSYLTEY